MGVIFTAGDDVSELLIPYIRSKYPGIKKDDIRRRYLSASLGKITARDFWAGLGVPEGEINSIQSAYLDNCFTFDEGFVACVKALKTRYIIALLSNDVAEWSAYLRGRYRINEHIDYAFISGEMGLRKPDPKIYERALDMMGVLPSECVFVDDSPERVAAAAKLGIESILFDRNDVRYEGLKAGSFGELTGILLHNSIAPR